MSAFLDELNELKKARDLLAIVTANLALAYVERIDIDQKREECELMLNKLKKVIVEYRYARQAYYDMLVNHQAAGRR